MSRFENEFTSEGTIPIRTRLKWFNAAKGFGFVSPVDGAADAFLHVSILHRAGLQELGDQAELICEIGDGPKGPQVMRIVETLSVGMTPSVPQKTYSPGGGAPYSSNGGEEELSGIVKWFKPEKGFGFITDENSEKDVFVHKSVLRRSGLNLLEAGQRVQMRVQQADKGREATWVILL